MRQKLALARALFHNPPVLLMDEPTSAMDPESARLVRDAIHGLRSANRAIIICTHNLAEAEELADKIAIIHQGRIIISGEVEELKTRLLGAPQFEVQLGSSIDGFDRYLPDVVTLTGQGPDWLRYQTDDPIHRKPFVIQSLVKKNIPVVGLSEVPRSLEKVYLQAINCIEDDDQHPGGSSMKHPWQGELSMLDSIRSALIITRRELRDQLRDWRIVFPIVALTLFFPFLANFTTRQILGFVRKYGANLLAERFIPFLLMIVGFFPISISLVIALESFCRRDRAAQHRAIIKQPID